MGTTSRGYHIIEKAKDIVSPDKINKNMEMIDTDIKDVSEQIKILEDGKLDKIIAKPRESLNQDLGFGQYHFLNATEGFPVGYTTDNDFIMLAYPSGNDVRWQTQLLFDNRSVNSYIRSRINGNYSKWILNTGKTILPSNLLLNGWSYRGGFEASQYVVQSGNMATLCLNLIPPSKVEVGCLIMYIPESLRPTSDIEAIFISGMGINTTYGTVSLRSNGELRLWDFDGVLLTDGITRINMSYSLV